jgi:hypothetical protein
MELNHDPRAGRIAGIRHGTAGVAGRAAGLLFP